MNSPEPPLAWQARLQLAGQLRGRQQWPEAAELYRGLAAELSGQGAYHHNFALCLLGAGEASLALDQARQALAAQPGLWQAAVVMVRALTALGRMREAGNLLELMHQRHPERGEFTLELASHALHQDCDALRCRQLVKPLLTQPAHAADAQLSELMASLYERSDGSVEDEPEAVNARAQAFARRWLDRGAPPPQAHAQARPRGRRLRVGLLSPHFNASPVYFFCVGALRLLAHDFELLFFSRSRREDWASKELRELAREWRQVSDLDAEALDAELRRHALDVLIDLGGWMDPIALKAISTKPAPRMAKWVGGQSITTGLQVFDAFITDLAQTPPGHERWFTEPLLRLPRGYVTYTPPPYMPAPVAASQQAHVLGISANPVKLSRRFLAGIQLMLEALTPPHNGLVLQLIDKRYSHQPLQARLREALQPAQRALGDRLRIEFISPSSHLDYLQAVSRLSEMLDTSPYSGGLTTMEALSLGVPCRGQAGVLFCERHTEAHRRYLRASGDAVSAPPPGPVAGSGRSAVRGSLIPPDAPRRDHVALAQALAQWLGGQTR